MQREIFIVSPSQSPQKKKKSPSGLMRMPSLHGTRLYNPAKASVAPLRALQGTCGRKGKAGAAPGLLCIPQLQIHHHLWASHSVLNQEFTEPKGS